VPHLYNSLPALDLSSTLWALGSLWLVSDATKKISIPFNNYLSFLAQIGRFQTQTATYHPVKTGDGDIKTLNHLKDVPGGDFTGFQTTRKRGRFVNCMPELLIGLLPTDADFPKSAISASLTPISL